MTVIELMQYLQTLCFAGKGGYLVRFADDPFTSKVFYVEPFSVHDPGHDKFNIAGEVTLASPMKVRNAA